MSTGLAEQVDQAKQVVCGHNSQAEVLAQLINEHPGQKRPLLQCNELLANIAQQRAEQLGTNSADLAITPNQIVIKGGFRVPNYYPVTGNQVEAVAKDFDSPEQVIKYLADSGRYSEHVLGSGEFFGLQSELGVGYFKANEVTSHDQWVVLIAQPWEPQKIVFKTKPLKNPIKVAEGCESDWKNSKNDFLIKKCRKMGRAKAKKSSRNN